MNTTVRTVDIIDKNGTLCGFKLFLREKDAERWMEENRVKYSEAGFTTYLGVSRCGLGE